MLKIGRIDYINSLPLFGGFIHKAVPLPGTLTVGHPVQLYNLLCEHKLDIALISSVALYTHQHEWTSLPDHGIACDGPVVSVSLYTKYPPEELHNKMVGLTSQSKTSRQLLKILLHNHWKVFPHFDDLALNTQTKDYDAYLLIGDDDLVHQPDPDYLKIDLGAVWKDFAQLPFVFALFAVTNEALQNKGALIAEFELSLQESYLWSKRNWNLVLENAPPIFTKEKCAHYLKHIQYQLTQRHWKGWELFTEMAYQTNTALLEV